MTSWGPPAKKWQVAPSFIIISVAPNGARRTKKDHPALPITPDELAKESRACLEQGAALFHLHVRDKNMKHTLDVSTYRSAISAIRKEVGSEMILQVTSESVGMYSPQEQMEMVKNLKPEAVSLAIREIIPNQESEKRASQFLSWILENEISPQYIVYSAEELQRFESLQKRGIIPGKKHFLLFVLGQYGKNAEASPRDLLPFLNAQKDFKNQNIDWAVCAFGKNEAACLFEAAKHGGHVRIGFENNLHLVDGTLANDNAALIEQFRKLSSPLNRDVLKSSEFVKSYITI